MLKYDNELGILCYNRENTAIVYAVVELPKNVIILYVCIILGIYYFQEMSVYCLFQNFKKLEC